MTTALPPSSEIQASAQFRSHFLGVAGASLLGLVLAFATFPIASRRWGVDGFGQYQILYRVLALTQPALLLGMGVAVTRELAHVRTRSRRELSSIALGALVPTLLISTTASLVLVALAGVWSRVIFGSTEHRGLIFALAVLIPASCACAIVQSALQGVFKMARANLLYLHYVGVAPLLSIILCTSVSAAIALTGVLWLIGTAVAARPLFARVAPLRARRASRDLWSYGGRRIPGELAAFALLTLPAISAAHTGNLRQAGFVAVGMSLVTLGAALCAPLSTVLLPHASARLASGDFGEFRRTFTRYLRGTVAVLVAMTLVVLVGAPLALSIGLGNSFKAGTTTIRLAALALAPYGTYVSLRSLLDAAHERIVTMRFTLYSLVCFVALGLFLASLHVRYAVMIAFVVSTWLLALLTVEATVRFLRTQRPSTAVH